jgi:hypothetical protein
MVCIRCKQEIGPRDKQWAVFGAKQVEVSGFSPSGAREYADGSTGWLHLMPIPWPVSNVAAHLTPTSSK